MINYLTIRQQGRVVYERIVTRRRSLSVPELTIRT